MPAETTLGMYQSLMLRDWAMHRRSILLGLSAPLFMGLVVFLFVRGGHEAEAPFAIGFLMGPVFISLLVTSLHTQDLRNGILGDLLALPIRRETLVHVRFLEGILGSILYVVSMLVVCGILAPSSFGQAFRIYFATPGLLWIFGICLAYPMPFTYRWGGKGSVAAYASFFVIPWILFGVFKLISLTGHEVTPYLCFMWIARHYDRLYAVLGRPLDFAIPILLILCFHRLSILALKRVDA